MVANVEVNGGSGSGGASGPTDYFATIDITGLNLTTTAKSYSFESAATGSGLPTNIGTNIALATNAESTTTTAKQPELQPGFYDIQGSFTVASNGSADSLALTFPHLFDGVADITGGGSNPAGLTGKYVFAFKVNLSAATFLDPRLQTSLASVTCSAFDIWITRLGNALT